MSPEKAVYIDDEPYGMNSAKDIARRLEVGGRLSVKHVDPPLNIRQAITEWMRDEVGVILVDYQLTVPSESPRAYSYGTSLAAEIRAMLPDYPIVMLTQRAPHRVQEALRYANPIVDDLVLKSEINGDRPQETALRIADLSAGYRTVRNSSSKTIQDLLDLLRVPPDQLSEYESIREAGIPLHGNRWEPEPLMRWLRNTFLEYPGLLMDTNRTSAYLGLAVTTFELPWVQEYFATAKYRGLFSESMPRCWKDNLLDKAVQLTLDYGIPGVYFKGTAPALVKLAEAQGHRADEVLPSRCVWDNSAHANMLCYLLEKPVQVENSLRYFPDERMASYEPARISFRAIREVDFDYGLLEAGLDELIDRIQNGEDPRDQITV